MSDYCSYRNAPCNGVCRGYPTCMEDVGASVMPPMQHQDDNLIPVAAPSATDPRHYNKHKIQPIEFLMANNVPYAEGNAIKYLMRWRDKGGVEDLKKARTYIDFLINQHETGSPL